MQTQTIDIGRFHQRPNEIRLRQDLMDKQIVDIDGRKVVRVNDLRLDEIEGKLHVVAVDVGAAGLLRRLGTKGAYRIVARNLRLPVPERYIDWEDVDPVESSIASIKLRVPHAGLAELHPADLASIIDQLAPKDRAGVLASLDDEAVADAIEEMEPDTQVEVIEDLEPARAADILEEMSPDDAADLVADLSDEAREEILALMEHDEAAEVEELLRYPEESAGGIMTTEFVAVPKTLTASQTIDRLRDLEPDAETIYYVYVTDDDDRLVGVLSLRDLIVAPPDTQIAGVMIRGAGGGGRARRPGRGGPRRRPLQPAGRAGRRRRGPPGRHRDRRRRHGLDPAHRLEEAAAAPLRAALSRTVRRARGSVGSGCGQGGGQARPSPGTAATPDRLARPASRPLRVARVPPPPRPVPRTAGRRGVPGRHGPRADHRDRRQ